MSFRGKQHLDPQLQLSQCKSYIKEVEKSQEEIEQGIVQVRTQAGRLFDRSKRLSRTDADTWSRNQDLELKLRLFKKKQEEIATYQSFVRSMREDLKNLAEEWNSSHFELQKDFDATKLRIIQLQETLHRAPREEPAIVPLSQEISDTMENSNSEAIEAEHSVSTIESQELTFSSLDSDRARQMARLRSWYAHSSTSNFQANLAIYLHRLIGCGGVTILMTHNRQSVSSMVHG